MRGLIASIGLLGTGCRLTGPAAPPGPERPTEAFRRHHVEIQEHLDHIAEWVGSLGTQTPARRAELMARTVHFLLVHIGPHAKWEEQVLYPVVDEYADGGAHAFTASMRHEHRIVGRWIEELSQEASRATPDENAFAKRAHELLGLLRAHFETEEEVLLPILDRAMTPEEFRRRVGSRTTGE